jgi:hypothetical protein
MDFRVYSIPKVRITLLMSYASNNHPHQSPTPEGYFKQTPSETIINRQYWVKVGKKPQTQQNSKLLSTDSLYLGLASPTDSTPRPLRYILNTKQQQQINRSTQRPRPQRRLAFVRIGFVYFLILT